MSRAVHIAPFLVLAIAASALTGCAGPSSRVVDLMGGQSAADVLADRTDAVVREAFRIQGDDPLGPKDPSAPGTIHGYPVTAGPVSVDAATGAAIAEILLDDDTYVWRSAKACKFLPGVAIRERRGETVVEVLLCFGCDEVQFWLDGARAQTEDTDPRRADLVRIAQRLFPDDAKLRNLR